MIVNTIKIIIVITINKNNNIIAMASLLLVSTAINESDAGEGAIVFYTPISATLLIRQPTTGTIIIASIFKQNED